MFHLGDKVQTRDGRNVILLKCDIKNQFTIVGIVIDADGGQNADVWDENGRYYDAEHDSERDLVAVEPTPTQADSIAKADINDKKRANVPAKDQITATATKSAQNAIPQEAPDADIEEPDIEDDIPATGKVKNKGGRK